VLTRGLWLHVRLGFFPFVCSRDWVCSSSEDRSLVTGLSPMQKWYT
jgi:hypothetical protein